MKNIFEVELSVKCETKSGDTILFLVEGIYNGIFTIENASEEILDKILLIECPKFLFPFLRAIIANCTREAGFPPLMIALSILSACMKIEKNKLKINF